MKTAVPGRRHRRFQFNTQDNLGGDPACVRIFGGDVREEERRRRAVNRQSREEERIA